MKYRIKKISTNNESYYIVQEKFLLFWINVTIANQFDTIDLEFVSEKEAKEWIKNQLSYKEEILN